MNSATLAWTRARSALFYIMRSGLFVALVAATAGLMAPAALAHEATMVDLRVREVAPGDFVWTWGIPAKGRPVSEDLRILWPAQCEVKGQAMRCGSQGLDGKMTIDGVGRAYSAVIMRVYWYSGAVQVVTLTEAIAGTRLFAGGQDARSMGEIAQTYGALGVEHILTGWDHLLFVISLLLLVGINRRLVGTITAFTVAHSLTLAGSALGWLTLRAAPVEASIALSIMLVCSESLHQRATLSRQWPALVALLFGLVHGLGFAGALKEIGLPEEHAAMALLTFNLGVEAGQILVVLACWALATVWNRSMASARTQTAPSAFGSADGPELTPAPTLNKNRAKRALVYAIGAMGAYWTISRVITIMLGS